MPKQVAMKITIDGKVVLMVLRDGTMIKNENFELENKAPDIGERLWKEFNGDPSDVPGLSESIALEITV